MTLNTINLEEFLQILIADRVFFWFRT